MKKISFIRKNNILFYFFAIAFFVFFSASCQEEETLVVNGPAPSPGNTLQVFDYNNNNWKDTLASLGRVLFYDKNLSLNNAISCGSCHVQQYAFADNQQFSRGLNNEFTSRNSSAILSSFSHNKFWDGRAGNADTAVFLPVQNHLEMDIFNLNILPSKLAKTTYYPELFKTVYRSSDIDITRIRQALAAFIEGISSMDSKYDRAIGFDDTIGDIDVQKAVLNNIETKGMEVFFGKGRCYNCHSGQNFNHYTSLYANIGLEVNYSDKGRSLITNSQEDEGKFMVPTLRNIALTAPYMHDGRYKTLREVIDHYDSGIQNSKNVSYHLRDIQNIRELPDDIITEKAFNDFASNFPIAKLSLTEDEKKALEAFLNTLTDVTLITAPKYSNPFH